MEGRPVRKASESVRRPVSFFTTDDTDFPDALQENTEEAGSEDAKDARPMNFEVGCGRIWSAFGSVEG